MKKRILRFCAFYLLPPLAFCAMWGIMLTCRKRFFITEEMKKENFIAAFWHGECAFLPFLYRAAKKQFGKQRDKGFYIISSEHFDGEIMVKLYGYFGLKTIRGSSSKGGLKVLLEAIKLLDLGYDLGITPDGPRGPYHSVADGVVAMAKKTGKKIVPLRVEFSSFWELKTWDKTRLPKPFSRVNFYGLKGIFIGKDMDLESAKILIKNALEKDLETIKKEQKI